jgi:hypothetical protein
MTHAATVRGTVSIVNGPEVRKFEMVCYYDAPIWPHKYPQN